MARKRKRSRKRSYRTDARIPAIRTGPQERDYFRTLRRLTDRTEELVREMLLPILPNLANEQRGNLALTVDAPLDDISRTMDDIRARLETEFEGFPVRTATDTGMTTSSVNRAQVQAQLAALGVDVFLDTPTLSPLLADFNQANVKLITSLPTQELDRIEGVIERGFRTGVRAGQLTEDIVSEFSVAKNRAKLIARDQIGRLNGQLTRQRQSANGITHFIWRNVADDRIRDEHEDGNGIANEKWPWATGAPGEGFPGDPINCRCYAEPVL